MAAATAGQLSLTTAEAAMFADDQGCSELYAACPAAETNSALVHVPGLHAANEFIWIGPGHSVVFRSSPAGIKSAVAKSNTGSSKVNFGVLAK